MSGATLRAGDGTGSRGAAPAGGDFAPAGRPCRRSAPMRLDASAGRPSRLGSPEGGRGAARSAFTSASPEGPAAALRRAQAVALAPAPERVPA